MFDVFGCVVLPPWFSIENLFVVRPPPILLVLKTGVDTLGSLLPCLRSCPSTPISFTSLFGLPSNPGTGRDCWTG
eukprot:6412184-Amphidinium_carterae.1